MTGLIPAPLAYSPKSACAAIGCGMTHLYELIAANLIEARKSGRKTLIPADSIRAYLEALPAADIRTGRGRQT
jgi:excisionase family DNA binding protein